MADFADVSVAFSLLNNSKLNGQVIRIELDSSLKNGKARNHGPVGVKRFEGHSVER